MMKRIASFAVLALTLSPPSSAMAAPAWTVDAAKSTLAFTANDNGKDFTGSFHSFTPVIAFDAQDLATSSVSVTIDTGSAATGDKTYDGSLPSAEWFNIKSFPAATFQSTHITATDATHFTAAGTLTILGVSKDISLPFTLTVDGKTAHATGHVSINRLDFGLGKTVDSTGSTVANAVTVSFDISAHQ
jgi:polyisoprenoid-binding protein YceI